MEKSIPKPETVPGTKSRELPSQEQVTEWIKRDINAASYFLSMMVRYPDIVDSLAREIYERILTEEQGALIDKVRKEAKNG